MTSGAPGAVALPRVALVEDDTLIRDAFATLQDLEVVGVYPSVEAFLDEKPQVDVLVLDLLIRPQMGPHPPLRGARAIRSVAPVVPRILLYTSEDRRTVLAACLASGAHGVVLKSEDRSTLVEAIRRVGAGEVVLTTALTGLAELVHRKGELPALPAMKLAVLRARARGESFQALSKRLHIAVKTADRYMAEINAEFANYLIRSGLSDGESSRPSPAVIEHVWGLEPGGLLEPGGHRE